MNRVTAAVSYKRRRLRLIGYLFCEGCRYQPPSEVASCVLETHHILQVAHGGDHSDENLVLLCGNCHRMAHALFPMLKRSVHPLSRALLLNALVDPDRFLMCQREKTRRIIESLR